MPESYHLYITTIFFFFDHSSGVPEVSFFFSSGTDTVEFFSKKKKNSLRKRGLNIPDLGTSQKNIAHLYSSRRDMYIHNLHTYVFFLMYTSVVPTPERVAV